MSTKVDSFCSVAEAAVIIDVSERRVQQFVKQGRIEHIRLNGKSGPILIPKKAAIEFAKLERPPGRRPADEE